MFITGCAFIGPKGKYRVRRDVPDDAPPEAWRVDGYEHLHEFMVLDAAGHVRRRGLSYQHACVVAGTLATGFHRALRGATGAATRRKRTTLAIKYRSRFGYWPRGRQTWVLRREGA